MRRRNQAAVPQGHGNAEVHGNCLAGSHPSVKKPLTSGTSRAARAVAFNSRAEGTNREATGRCLLTSLHPLEGGAQVQGGAEVVVRDGLLGPGHQRPDGPSEARRPVLRLGLRNGRCIRLDRFFLGSQDPDHGGAYGDRRADIHQQFGDLALLLGLHIQGGHVGLDHCHRIARTHVVARLNEPLHQLAVLQVRAKGGQSEFTHMPLLGRAGHGRPRPSLEVTGQRVSGAVPPS